MQKQTLSPLKAADISVSPARPSPDSIIEYFGSVNHATNERVLSLIKDRMRKAPDAELTLLVTSPGGPSGIAMSFYDTVRSILRPNLTTVAMGDTDSSGIIIFLAGARRLVSEHTTLLLHPAGRSFDPTHRYTAVEIAAMAREDALKDEHYADILAKHSRGRLTPGQVLTLMECHTVLSAADLLRYGLADALLQ